MLMMMNLAATTYILHIYADEFAALFAWALWFTVKTLISLHNSRTSHWQVQYSKKPGHNRTLKRLLILLYSCFFFYFSRISLTIVFFFFSPDHGAFAPNYCRSSLIALVARLWHKSLFCYECRYALCFGNTPSFLDTPGFGGSTFWIRHGVWVDD